MPSKTTNPRGSRNPLLAKGVERFSRSASYKKKGKWAVKNKTAQVKPAVEKKVVTKTLKNGQTRVIAKKTPRWYPADDVKRALPSRKANARPTRLRSSLVPGTVVILLAGRFRGKRAVFLKQLSSGLLLVTGPYKVNGIPLRRVNQAYVIATSTRVDVSGVKVADKFNDDYFKKPRAAKNKKTEQEFFGEGEKKKTIDAARKEDQKAVDAALLKAVQAVPTLPEYLGARFTLKKGQFPHDLKF
jgi:large subunit ribosomal protein L6e